MIKTIDINAKHWFDKKNGNSYFAGVVTLNYSMKSEQAFLMPFQYGYGNSYEYEAKNLLTEFNKISPDYTQNLRRYCEDNNIILRRNFTEYCSKSELKQIEINYNNNL
jgi:hypothetical protein